MYYSLISWATPFYPLEKLQEAVTEIVSDPQDPKPPAEKSVERNFPRAKDQNDQTGKQKRVRIGHVEFAGV